MSTLTLRGRERNSTQVLNNEDLLKVLISYLGGLCDLVHCGTVNVFLGKVCRKSSALRTMMLRNMHKKILSFHLITSELNAVMQLTNSIIGGSTALSFVTGDNHAGDLDVYTPIGYGNAWRRFLEQNQYMICNGRHRGIDVPSPNAQRYLDVGIEAVHRYEHREKFGAIEIILMHEGYSPREAISNYDLSFLQNYYDGCTFFIQFPQHVLERKGVFNIVSSRFD